MIRKSIGDKPQSLAVVAVHKRMSVSSYECHEAASAGDIQWLDQTLKSIQEERGKENIVTFDKNVSFIQLC